MENIKKIVKELVNDKKKLGIVIGGLVLLIIVIIVLSNIIGKANDKKNVETIEETLTSLGKEFYEEHYHVNFEDPKQLANFKDTGLNISITDLNVILPLDKDMKERLNNKECNLDNTKIIIVPKSPYGVKDYSLEVELACKK